MNTIQLTIIGVLIPFIGTTIGAALVFLLKNKVNKLLEKLLLGFAAGVMLAASVWSLIIPAIEMAEKQGKIPWLPATIGVILGVITFIVVNNFAKKIEEKNKKIKKEKNITQKIKKSSMLILAVTLHNIPEG